MTEQIDQLEAEASQDLAAISTADDLEQFRIKYLGAKGALKQLMTQLKDVPKEQKPAFGQSANQLRKKVEAAFDEHKATLGSSQTAKSKGPMIDITQPGLEARLGREHITTLMIVELAEVFGRMGFDIAVGPEIEDERHNFIALNIPETHPARDPLDNFYLTGQDMTPSEAGGTAKADMKLLRSQTSTVQIRVMEETEPPIRVVSMGRVYRPDAHDATHYSMFHQVEGLYVDKHVTLVDLKTTLIQFARAMYGPEAEIKLVPSYFPFTEPSAELYVKMQVGDKVDWVEVGGCGMVDPAVFEQVGYDPEVWTGFAFGLGIERLAMKKFNIPDIRWLFENDVRFLRQF